MSIKSQEEIEKQIFDMVGTEFVLLSKYKGNREDILLGHYSEYGYHELVTNMNAFVTSGGRCRECSLKSRRKTPEQFPQEVKSLVGDEYKINETYQTSVKKIRFTHVECGYEFRMTPNDFLSGRRCPKCAGQLTPTQKEFENRVETETNGEYKAIGKYTRAADKVKIYHKTCKKTWYITPNNFFRGKRCPHCYGNFKKDTAMFRDEVFNLVGEEYIVVGEYINTDTHIEFRHEKCGNTFFMRPSNFLEGSRCHSCAQSKGEIAIESFLNNHKITYKRQYKFDDCRNGNYPLPFDFSVFDEAGKLAFLIEYDGIQHFEPIDFFGGEKQFIRQQINDNIKNEYCEDKEITLLRIPYWDKNNIEKILESQLKKIKW